MKLLMNKNRAGCMLAFLLVLSLAVVSGQTNTDNIGVSGTVAGLRIALGYHENGQIKSQLRAEKATIQENGPIYATNITSEFFTVDGVLDVVMKAEDCVYDKQAKLAKSENNVSVDKKGISITGKGFEWDSKEQVIRVLSNVKVVFNRGIVNLNMLKGKKK